MSFTSKTYTGETFTPVIKNFDAATMTKSGTESAKNADTYTITISLKNPAQYTWKDGTTADVVLTWKINVKSISRVSLTQASYEYNGADISALLKNFDASSNWYTATGDLSAKNVGSYNITIDFKSEHQGNVKWSSGSNTTSPLTFTWTITRQKLSAAMSTFVQDIEIVYGDGFRKWFEFFSNTANLSQSKINLYYTMEGVSTGGVALAKTYTAQISPTENYCWSDGSFSAKEITFAITPLKISRPSISNSNFVYDGTEKSPTVSPTIHLHIRTDSSTKQATAAGSYAITYYIKYNSDTSINAVWEDTGTTEDITFSWKIEKKVLTRPTATNTYFTQQDGVTHSLTLVDYDSSLMTQSGKISASAVGTYTAYFTLIDSTNYKWEGTTAAKISLKWEIGGTALPVPTVDEEILPYQTGAGYPTWQVSFSNFNKDLISYSLEPLDGTWRTSSDALKQYSSMFQVQAGHFVSESGGGLPNAIEFNSADHKQRIKITFSLKDSKNYKWIDNTATDKDVTVTLLPLVLTGGLDSPVQDIPCTYDGTNNYWEDGFSDIANKKIYFYDDNKIYDTENFINAGTYTIPLKPQTWCTWSNGTFGSKNITFKVKKATPTLYVTDDAGNTFNADNADWIRGQHDFTPKISSRTFTITTDGGHAGAVCETLNAFGGNISNYMSKNISSSTGTATATFTALDSAVAPNDYAIRLTFQVGSTANYASRSLMIDLNVYTKLEDYTWTQIAEMAANNTLADVADPGDTKSLTVTGEFGEIDFGTGTTLQAVLLGINHNAAIEGNKRAHFAIVKSVNDTSYSKTLWRVLSPLNWNSSTSTPEIADSIQPFTFNYAYENFYRNISGGPKEFIKDAKKYVGTTPHTNKIWLPSWFEWHGSKSNTLPDGYSENYSYQAQYSFFLNGNSVYMEGWAGGQSISFPVWSRSTDGTHYLAIRGPVDNDTPLKLCGVILCFAV